jgi:hypothetical protein
MHGLGPGRAADSAPVSPSGEAATGTQAGGLADRFAHPPAGNRILKIIHSWPDSPEAQD